MNIDFFNKKLADKFDCEFLRVKTNHHCWERIFVLDTGVSIGRLSFEKGKLSNIKSYKPYEYPLCNTDKIMLRLEHFINTQRYVSEKLYNELVKKATILRQKDLDKKVTWRKAHPKKRKKLFGRNIRNILISLIEKY